MTSSKDDTDAPGDDVEPSVGDEDGSVDDADPSGDDADEAVDGDGPVEGDDPSATPLAPEVMQRFVSSKEARTVAESVLRKIVPRAEVADLATDALVRALKARAPAVEAVLPAWLARIAHRTGAAWLKKRKRREKYEGDMPVHVSREDDYTGEGLEDDDGPDTLLELEGDDDPGELLGPYLDRLIGEHDKDREVREILREHAEQKKPYAVIASERGMTPKQLSSRVERFKAKYAPRVKRRRTQMFLLKLFAGLAAVAAAVVLAWWLLHRRPVILPDPSPPALPTPSASASAPPPEPFMPAVPPSGTRGPDDKR